MALVATMRLLCMRTMGKDTVTGGGQKEVEGEEGHGGMEGVEA